MKLRKLYLQAFGPFTDQVLDFGGNGQSLVLVYGPNEAGKSAMLRAISDLRFGIPTRSTDDFVHKHPDMRIGGVFVDRDGREHAFVRRKGRGATLHLARETEGRLVATDEPAPAALEAVLTGGLRREEYDLTYGLDHQRLRQGGEALVKGEGEVGAALFEASAGVRSIPAVVDKLDQTARKFFIPGSRGKNAPINEALAAYDAHHDTLRAALVRPSLWADLSRAHDGAAANLKQLVAERHAVNERLLRVKELRSVAPLLRRHDEALRLLAELQHAVLLPPDAAARRATAEAALANALQNENAAREEAERQQATLSALHPDDTLLASAAAVERLGAAAEAAEAHRKDLAAAQADVTLHQQQLADLARRISPEIDAQALLARAPSATTSTAIEATLRSAERAEEALQQRQQSLEALKDDDSGPEAKPLPAPEVQMALRAAQQEVTRNDATLRRLAALPADIKAAQRKLEKALATIGLRDAAALQDPQPLLDAEIDAARSAAQQNEQARIGLAQRIAQITEGIHEQTLRKDKLLATGNVATQDDVQAARQRRERGWALVRGTYIEGAHPPHDDYTAGRPLPEAYEADVATADRLADDLSRDSARAADLQAANEAIASRQRDRDALQRETEALLQQDQARQQAWAARLAQMRLPALPPAELREWQQHLAAARACAEAVTALEDEAASARELESALERRLRESIVATGMAQPAAGAALGTLASIAAETVAEIDRQDKAASNAATLRQERRKQRLKAQEQLQQATAAAESARTALAGVLSDLLLPAEASSAMARARMGEFQALTGAQGQILQASARAERAQQALALLVEQAESLAERLGDVTPADVRLYADDLALRLAAARDAESQRKLAQQAYDAAVRSQRNHEQEAAQHRAKLEALCRTAGVPSPAELPLAEDQSERKREHTAALDRSRIDLADASQRTPDELRAMLQGTDTATLEDEEADCQREATTLDEKLEAARKQEEEARRALEAIDSSDAAATAREAMEGAAARVRANIGPWIRSRLAHALLQEALRRFRERAQGPMLRDASRYFEQMTAGEFVRLAADDTGPHPVLLAHRKTQPETGIGVEAMSEGTRDQLYLALRLAALGLRRQAGVDLPAVLDDVLMTSDDGRAALMLKALAGFSEGGQVMVFTHHGHLVDVARTNVPKDLLHVERLAA